MTVAESVWGALSVAVCVSDVVCVGAGVIVAVNDASSVMLAVSVFEIVVDGSTGSVCVAASVSVSVGTLVRVTESVAVPDTVLDTVIVRVRGSVRVGVAAVSVRVSVTVVLGVPFVELSLTSIDCVTAAVAVSVRFHVTVAEEVSDTTSLFVAVGSKVSVNV